MTYIPVPFSPTHPHLINPQLTPVPQHILPDPVPIGLDLSHVTTIQCGYCTHSIPPYTNAHGVGLVTVVGVGPVTRAREEIPVCHGGSGRAVT